MIQPVMGMTTAMVSMKPVVSHCAVRSSMLRSTMIFDNATLSAVSLRITTKAPISSTVRTRIDWADSLSGRAWVADDDPAGAVSVCGMSELPG